MSSCKSTSAPSSRSSSRLSQRSQLSRLSSGSSQAQAPPYSPLALSSLGTTPRRRTPEGHHVFPKGLSKSSGGRRRTPNGVNVYSKFDSSAPTFRPIGEESDEEGSHSATVSRVSSISENATLSRVTSASSNISLDPLPYEISVSFQDSPPVSRDVPTGSLPLTRRRSASVPDSSVNSEEISRTGSGCSSYSSNAELHLQISAQLALAAAALSTQ
jgi:hypothetical protein